MKKKKLVLIFMILLMPMIVYASDGSGTNDYYSFILAFIVEGVLTIPMVGLVFKPISERIAKGDIQETVNKFILARIVVLVLADLFISPSVFIIDAIFTWISVIIFAPLAAIFNKTKLDQQNYVINSQVSEVTQTNPAPQINGTQLKCIKTNGNLQIINSLTNIAENKEISDMDSLLEKVKNNEIEIKCAKCNNVLNSTDDFCSKCGAVFEGNIIITSETVKNIVTPANFDSAFSLTENRMLEEFINRELTKAGIDKSSKLIPSELLKRKRIFNIIFSVLLFIYISMIFFHFPIYTYIIGLIVLFIFFKVSRNYNLVKYLKKQLKARPSEKITNIVMNVKNTFVSDNTRPLFFGSLLAAIVLPLIIFSSPRILYEKVDGGYAVRYYIFGLTNFKTATIPEMHNGEKVVVLRGNTFSNMPFLEKVELPNSLIEIRGQAFKNCVSLKEVNIPDRLEYLGGGAFYNAISIEKVELPDSLTYLGGESFSNARKLKEVRLSENLSEIRGNTFENCESLTSITIPDNVERIGGHAFYGTGLSEVNISRNSKLKEIGSSAFRQCYSLAEITIPYGVQVNPRAFKESPTYIKSYPKNY